MVDSVQAYQLAGITGLQADALPVKTSLFQDNLR
jgi:hypothetical protein